MASKLARFGGGAFEGEEIMMSNAGYQKGGFQQTSWDMTCCNQ